MIKLQKRNHTLITNIVYLLRGVPFIDCTDWKSLKVPRFPLFYTILTGLFFGLWYFLSFTAFYVYRGITKMICACLLTSLCGIPMFLIFNFALLLWFMLVKKLMCYECERKDIIEGGRRITYFSTAYQFIPLLATDLAIILQKSVSDNRWLMILLGTIVTSAYLLRLAAAFMSIKREEPHSKFAPFIGCVPYIAFIDVLSVMGILRLTGSIIFK